MSNFKKFILSAILLISSSVLTAQTKIINGNVTAANNPLGGVTVQVKGTSITSMTGENGSFTIEVPANAKFLIFSFVGMETQEVPLSGKTNFEIQLKTLDNYLNDVVVVGYGTEKKVDLTGSVSSVSGDILTKRPVTSAAETLQGLIPGVSVVNASGQPGEGYVNIKVRGLGTFSGAGSNPLVLIDGVPGDLGSLNPYSIASVAVLKDAASAAIYGSRAANGVILVTTKNGNTNAGKLKLDYNFNYGINTPTKMLDLVTNSVDYMKAWNTNIKNSNYGVDIPNKEYTQDDMDDYANATDKNLYPNFSWLDYLINPAPTMMHNLTLSGGGKTHFNLSLSGIDEKGTLAPYRYKNYNVQLSLVSEVSKKVKFGFNTILKDGNTYGNANWFSDDLEATNYFLCMLAQPPTYKPLVADGSGYYSWRAYPFEANNWNPYFMSKDVEGKNINYAVSGQAWADIEILNGLHWYSKLAVNYDNKKGKGFVAFNDNERLYRDPTVLGYGNISFLAESFTDNLYKNFYSYLSYEKQLAQHRFNFMLGFSSEDNQSSYITAYRSSFFSATTPELNAGSPSGQTNGGSSSEWALESYFGRMNYSFKGKYLAEVNVRADGTSRLAPGSRWGIFPSFSGGWRFTQEKFMDGISWLTNGKLRASWGVLGNQNIGTYPYQSLLSYAGVYPFNNSSLSQGVAQVALNNVNIKWETTKTSDIGIDLTLFNNLSISFDVYKKYTSDILRAAQVTGVVGLSAPIVNSGAMQNTGFDLDLQYRKGIKSGALMGLNLGGGLVVSSFKNKLVKFGVPQDNSFTIDKEGSPWNTFYLLQVEGIFQSQDEIDGSAKQFGENTQPGMLKFKDVSGPNGKPDNVIDNYDRVPMTKGVFPAFTYGFNFSAEWKGFDLYGFLQGVSGSRVYVTGWGVQPFYQGTAPTKQQFAESWTPENHSNSMVQLGDPTDYNHPSTYLLKDNSYLRLKSLQLGYSLPEHLISKLYMKKLRFYCSADNLLTFSKYPGLDPERSGSGDFVSYPQNKIISFGCNVTF